MNLQRGMRDRLDKYLNTNQPFEVTMDVQGSAVYDYCCFGVDSAGKLSDDRYMVFYNQTESPQNEISYCMSGHVARFIVNLGKLPASIQKIVFTVSIDGNGIMGDISSHTLTVRQGYGDSLDLNLSGADFHREKAIITIEIYRKDSWRLAVIANGFNGGLGDLLRSYGGEEMPVKPNNDDKLPDHWKDAVGEVISDIPGSETLPLQEAGYHQDRRDDHRRSDSEEILDMIYKATKLIQREFKQAGIKCTAREVGEFSFVEASFTGKNCNVTIRFISTDNDHDVKALTDNFAKFPPQRLAKGLEIINDLNKQYRYAKFTISPTDGYVTAEYDFPATIKEESVGTIAAEIVLRFAQIVDDAYPVIMQSVWAR